MAESDIAMSSLNDGIEAEEHAESHNGNADQRGLGQGIPSAILRKDGDVGLGDSDIERNVYEGGFKSWEGAMDLAEFVMVDNASQSPHTIHDEDAVLEVRVTFGHL